MNCQYCVYYDKIVRYGTDYDDNPIYCCTVSKSKFTDGVHGPSGDCAYYYDIVQYNSDQVTEQHNALRKKADEEFVTSEILRAQEKEAENNNRQEQVYQRSVANDPASSFLCLLPFVALVFIAYNWGVTALKAYGIFLIVLTLLIYNGIISISEGSLLYKLFKLFKNIITVGLALGLIYLFVIMLLGPTSMFNVFLTVLFVIYVVFKAL